MDVSKLNSTVLRSLIKLTDKRDALLAELKKIEASIASVTGGKAPAAGKPAKAAVVKAGRKKRGKRGALKEKILAALREGGAKGVAVKDLSKKLGVKNQNVHVWFSSTGRKLGGIQKIGAGRYRLKAGA